MPNAIKYSASAQTLALKKGNFWIGTGDVGKGPTSTTDYWNGITPPSGGYTIYLNKSSNGPSMYTAANDAQLISLTNTIAGTSYTTAAECLVYYSSQSDKMCFNRDCGAIPTNGLILNLDAGFTPSYPTSGTTWYDTSSAGSNSTLLNGVGYSSSNGGSLVFDGSDDYGTLPSGFSDFTGGISICSFVKFTSNRGWERIIEMSNGSANNNIIFCRAGDTSDIIFIIWVTNYTAFALTLNGITNGSWAFYAMSMTPSSASVYINTNKSTTSNVTLPVNVTRTVNYIAKSAFNDSLFLGNIGEVSVYNRGLSDAEITQYYNANKGRYGL